MSYISRWKRLSEHDFYLLMRFVKYDAGQMGMQMSFLPYPEAIPLLVPAALALSTTTGATTHIADST